ncbi:hypothetical protein Q5425_36730 [Amycolatopsis sp. A133]|uniref:hypothetical protein n=1 Tax=Amycolatopsis sp. A133 TaxID=3064472 RepID=UPI0027F1B4F8|nr:hypothetical protein [Amycolatopsis sp. A133]MDQ7809303.1 hypothetical protein [Amycolatopsis sp. A133]
MAPPLTSRRRLAAVVAGFLALAAAACAPAPDRPPSTPGKAHGIAVDGKLTTKAGVREEQGLSRAGTGTHG